MADQNKKSFFALLNPGKLLPILQDKFGRNPENRNDDDGPPELDELWRRFNDRLKNLFKPAKPGSQKKGQGGQEPPDEPQSEGRMPHMPRIRLGIVPILIIIVMGWLATGFFIVQEGETGVVMTFGRFSHMTTSGVNWRYPYPIQSHEVVNVSQVRTIEVGYRTTLKNKQLKEALMLTHDENIIDIQFAVQYRLKNAADWVFNNRNQEEMVRQVAETAIREVVGKNKMDFVLYEGRDKIAFDVNRLMQEIFDQYGAGVQITNVTMQGVQPPEQVQAAFDDAVKAGQDRERQKNEGQAYANDVIPKARGAAARLLQEAEGYKERVVANAQGDAARFKHVLTEYQKAPAVTRDRMYLETMQQIFSNTTKLMMDVKGGNNLLYLPLDKLMSKEVQAAPEQAANAETAPATPPAEGVVPAGRAARDNRGREAR